ncbi:MAG: phytanoyl-CoA dioxygenase family protein [Vicinamibacterales bacterium]|jgi:hypothetical protein
MALSPRDRARAFMASLAMPDEAAAARLHEATDIDYWRRLNPQLSIGSPRHPSIAEGRPWSPVELDSRVAHMARAGYLQAAPFGDPDVIAALHLGVERIREAGWPPVFLFVYDQVWDLARTPSVQALLRAVLGPGYREDTLVWCFHVAPKAGASGWAPHFDGPEKSNRMTVWFPLTDATLDNGCMYVVPDGALPASISNEGGEVAVNWSDLSAVLRSARALPCAAGGMLGWRFHVLHWSSVVVDATTPRISVAMEFLGADVTPVPLEEPLIDPTVRPESFHTRLYAIGKSLRIYIRFEPWLAPFANVAQRLEEDYRPPAGGTI